MTAQDLHRAPATIEPDGSVGKLRTRWGIAIALGIGFGLAAAVLTPRGPVTTGQALASMAAAVAVGVAAGLLTANRWSMVAVPAASSVAFELGRVGAAGPTVDAVDPGSFYGIVALVTGRLLPGLLVLAPMALAAWWGVVLARRAGHGAARQPRLVGWVLAVAATAGLVLAVVVVARPATTAPIVGGGGIAELVEVPIGGTEQALMLRGRDTSNPVLLYLAGGPGGTDLGALRLDTGLEQDFVVAAWDQRGAGRSYPAYQPEEMTLDRLVADTVEVTDYLRERFDEDRIYLVGQSWGSTLGVLAVQEHPERYHGFVGVGQMVSQRATDVMFWEDTLAWAERTGNTELATELRANGPPPYTDLYDYDPVINHEHDWNPYPEFDPATEMPAILFVPEYSFIDRVNAFRGFLDTAWALYPQLQDIDFRTDVPRLDVPVYVVLGEHEARGRAVLAEEWFEQLDSPDKELIVFEGSGHRPNFDRPGEFAELMRRVADETGG